MNLDSWKQVSIGSVANVNPPLPRVPSKEESVSFLSMSDVGEGRILRCQTRFAKDVPNGFTQFADGDVLIAKITPCFENGKGCLCSGLENGLGFGSTEFIVLRPTENVDGLFLYYHTIADSFRRAGTACMVGSAGQKRLQPGFVRTYPIQLPPLPEQRGIASLLADWDAACAIVERLIVAKSLTKDGLVRQLLDSGARFRPFAGANQKSTRLEEVFEKVSEPVKVKADEIYQQIGIKSHGRGIFHKKPVLGHFLGKKRVYRVIPGCLTLNIVFAWERALAVTTELESGMIASHRFPMFRPDTERILPEYALLYLLSRKGTQALGLASPGGAGRNRTLSQTELLKAALPLPTIAEQRRIISFVNTADLEIALLRKELDGLKKQKRGLMRELLTGQMRVRR